jgi:putative transposase
VTADVHLLADETKTSVAAVCRALELPRSSVYARRKRPQSRRALNTAQLDVEVAAAHAESKQRYGSPRVHRALRRKVVVSAASASRLGCGHSDCGRSV